MCVTVERSEMSRFTEGSWLGSFTANNERAIGTLKPSSGQKRKCFERIPSRPEFACKLPGMVFQLLPFSLSNSLYEFVLGHGMNIF